jgi:hypothetical protein
MSKCKSYVDGYQSKQAQGDLVNETDMMKGHHRDVVHVDENFVPRHPFSLPSPLPPLDGLFERISLWQVRELGT